MTTQPKHGLERTESSTEDLSRKEASAEVLDLLRLIQLLNSPGRNPLRELVVKLCELNYGEIDREIAGAVDKVFQRVSRRINVSPCLHERPGGKLMVTFLPRKGDTIFQTEAWNVALLASRGLLCRIHQCPRCKTWFLSKREREPHVLRKPCKDNCRIAIHRQKPEVKKKLADDARRRYRENVQESLAIKKLGLKTSQRAKPRA
jgi:hypothetical protein